MVRLNSIQNLIKLVALSTARCTLANSLVKLRVKIIAIRETNCRYVFPTF